MESPYPSGKATLVQSKPSTDFGAGKHACLSRRALFEQSLWVHRRSCTTLVPSAQWSQSLLILSVDGLWPQTTV